MTRDARIAAEAKHVAKLAVVSLAGIANGTQRREYLEGLLFAFAGRMVAECAHPQPDPMPLTPSMCSDCLGKPQCAKCAACEAACTKPRT